MPEPSPPFQKSIIKPHSIIIVGLSGGPDSIYLLHQLHQLTEQLNITIIAAHLNHEWQESSDIAAQLCQETCNALNIICIIKKLSELAYQTKWNGSQEQLGRSMRRHFFTTVAQEYQASAIALAHHQQDQHETFFIRLLRGSSLKGLTGIQEQQDLYIRPILHCTKQEILNYLHTRNIAYYTDPTNCSDAYLRNRIRNHVIPALQKADQRFDQKLSSAMLHLTQVEDFLNKQMTEALTAISTAHGFDIQKFLSLHIIVQQRILLELMITEQVTFTPSQKLFKEIMRFLEKSSSHHHIIYNSWMIQKNKFHFTIKKYSQTVVQTMTHEKNEKTL